MNMLDTALRVTYCETCCNHARRPDRVQLVEGLKPNNGELPWGFGRLWQDYTLRRVERDDET